MKFGVFDPKKNEIRVWSARINGIVGVDIINLAAMFTLISLKLSFFIGAGLFHMYQLFSPPVGHATKLRCLSFFAVCVRRHMSRS